ncbi:MAG: hypothetical protein V4690_01345 [Patescibacteria group bacterium]
MTKEEGGSLVLARVLSLVRAILHPSSTNKDMKILRVVGWALAIIMLKFLVPRIFSGFENTLLAFFETIQTILASSKSSMTAGIVR